MAATLLAPRALAPAPAPSPRRARAASTKRAASRPRLAPPPLRAVDPETGEWVSVRDTIEEKIVAALAPTYVLVRDDSEKHALHKGGQHDGHAGVRSNESHFSVTVVSEQFAGMTPIKRHRLVNSILQKEFDDGLHALQLSTKTPAEWEKTNK